MADPAHADPRAEADLAPWHRHGPVLIVGGGIGGLATALALARRHIPSQVLERRPAFAEEGAGIQIGPNGTAILEALGVASVLRASIAAPNAIRVQDGRDGRELARLPLGRWIKQRHGASYWTAHRQDLHAALLARVTSEPLIRLALGASFQRVERVRFDAVRIRSGDGRIWSGSVLIGADGLWSSVRHELFTPREPRFAGSCAVRTTIPADLPEVGAPHMDVVVWLRPDAHVVHYPVRGGREIAVVGIFRDASASQDWSGDTDPAWVAQQVACFPAKVRSLFAAAPAWRKWGLHTLRPSFAWANGNVALLGDAAHSVLPFLAQGAVLALEDAVSLAEALASHRDVPRALQAYERGRRPRAAKVAAAARRNGRIYHLAGAMAGARNLVLRAVPGERLMAGYDWLYGWRAWPDD